MSDDRKPLNRRQLIKLGLYNAAGVWVAHLIAFGESVGQRTPTRIEDLENYDWGFIVDTTRCIGCGSCVRACKLENKVPDSYFRTWIERYEINEDGEVHVDSPDGGSASFRPNDTGESDNIKAFFVPKLCNHCRNSACTQVCPVGATYCSPDGVVLIDREHCVGCGYCVQACPYGCRYIYHPAGTADKCSLCYHRIHRGKPTACVSACPRHARICGNLKDPDSQIRKFLHRRRYNVLQPAMGTNPKCYYVGLDVEVK